MGVISVLRVRRDAAACGAGDSGSMWMCEMGRDFALKPPGDTSARPGRISDGARAPTDPRARPLAAASASPAPHGGVCAAWPPRAESGTRGSIAAKNASEGRKCPLCSLTRSDAPNTEKRAALTADIFAKLTLPTKQ